MTDSPGRVIAIATVKGGSGKTTLAMCLAARWLYAGRATAVIDTDPQRSARRWAFAGSQLEIMRVDVCPPEDGDALTRLIAALRGAGFERIVVDTPGYRSPALLGALSHADLVVVPVRPSPVDFEVAADTFDLMRGVTAERPERQAPTVRMVLTQVTPRTVIAGHMRDELIAAGYPLLTHELSHRVAFAEAPFTGSVPGLIDPRGAAAREVEALGAELDAVLKEMS